MKVFFLSNIISIFVIYCAILQRSCHDTQSLQDKKLYILLCTEIVQDAGREMFYEKCKEVRDNRRLESTVWGKRPRRRGEEICCGTHEGRKGGTEIRHDRVQSCRSAEERRTAQLQRGLPVSAEDILRTRA